MNLPLAHLVMLRVGQDHLAGVEHDGPDWSTLEVIAEMEQEKASGVRMQETGN
jgi:hypothetical protein